MHNDNERGLWIDNDEGLYNFFRFSHLTKREFIRQNREIIDSVIDNVVGGKKPAHYLSYQ
jgi:hypothetical protein